MKQTRLTDPMKRAVPSHQLSGAFRTDSRGVRQFVRRITAERDKVRHLVWINAISFPHLFGPDARYSAAPRPVEAVVFGEEAESISISLANKISLLKRSSV